MSILMFCTNFAFAGSTKPIPVEFWHVGDDGLSERLADCTEKAFKQSTVFRLSSGRKPGTLIVEIPTNVGWERIGKRVQVHYSVNFSLVDGRKLDTKTGSCWDNDLKKCAMVIVNDAAIMAASALNIVIETTAEALRH
jgi:hypothetical protein